MLELHHAGHSPANIAAQIGRSELLVWRALKSDGIQVRESES